MEETRPDASGLPPSMRTGTGRGSWYVAVVILAGIAIVAAMLVLNSDDEPSPPTSTTTTARPTTTTAPTTPPARDNTAVWPRPGSADAFATARAAAESFAVDFLGFKKPVVGEFRQGDSRSGEVDVRPIATGPATTVLVRQLSGEDTWSVLGSTTANIEVTAPESMASISSPVRVTGRAVAFEGTVNVHVRTDEGRLIGDSFVTGGGDVMRPFAGTIAFETPGTPYGALIFATYSAEDGRLWEAASFRVAFATSTGVGDSACGGYRSPRPTLASDEMEVKVFFSCDAAGGDGPVFPVYRAAKKSPGVLRAAVEAQLRGPTPAERDAKVSSFFSTETAPLLHSVTVNDGHAVIDFGDLPKVIPNASSSAGSARLLAELDTTVFQFASVKSVEYRLEGDCEAFSEWLQYGGCEPRTRGTSET